MRNNRLRPKEQATAYLFLLPSFVAFMILLSYPIVYGFLLSFTNNKGINSPLNFVGLASYARLLRDSYFSTSLLNNLIYVAIYTPLVTIVSLLFAVILNQKIFGRQFFRTTFFFPYITSMVSVAIIWNYLLAPDGPINNILKGVGLSNPPEWLISQHWALFSVVIVSVWKEFGFYMIILLAGLQTIPAYLYEAAIIDGANPWQKFYRITLPMLSPTLFLCIVMAIISSFQVFDLINVMTKGGPGRATNVLVFRIFQEGFMNMKMGYASAIAYILFLIILVATIIQFSIQNKWVKYNQ